MKKALTPHGRIAVIKSLLMSKLSYVVLTLPRPSESFQKHLFKNVWIQNPDKVKENSM